LRYDLSKLRAKGLVEKIPHSCSVSRYWRKFSHVNYDGSFGVEWVVSLGLFLSVC
jgi:hypothetical protein